MAGAVIDSTTGHSSFTTGRPLRSIASIIGRSFTADGFDGADAAAAVITVNDAASNGVKAAATPLEQADGTTESMEVSMCVETNECKYRLEQADGTTESMEVSMWRLMSASIAVAAATLIAATATEAVPVNAAANVRTGLVGGQQSLVTQIRFTPPGFSHGRKVGWHGRHHPPGWSEGRKVGWHHASMPPGLRR